MSIRDSWEFIEEFDGCGVIPTTPGAGRWVITDTSSSGTPTYAVVDHGETTGSYRPGVFQIAFDTQNEAQNVCLSFGDKLCYDIDKLRGFECGLRFIGETGSAKDAATTLAFGMTGDRNDAIDSIAIAALFRLAAGTADQAIVLETDDGTTNNDDVDAGFDLTDSTWANFKIDFSNLESVRFSCALADSTMTRRAGGTTFDMSAYAGALQPFFQLQKTADANADKIQIDYVRIWGVR